MEFGEKSTRYFFNLEKEKHNQCTIIALLTANNQKITLRTDILKEIGNFFSNLYTSREADLNPIEGYLDTVQVPQLTEDEKLILANCSRRNNRSN